MIVGAKEQASQEKERGNRELKVQSSPEMLNSKCDVMKLPPCIYIHRGGKYMTVTNYTTICFIFRNLVKKQSDR